MQMRNSSLNLHRVHTPKSKFIEAERTRNREKMGRRCQYHQSLAVIFVIFRPYREMYHASVVKGRQRAKKTQYRTISELDCMCGSLCTCVRKCDAEQCIAVRLSRERKRATTCVHVCVCAICICVCRYVIATAAVMVCACVSIYLYARVPLKGPNIENTQQNKQMR